MLLLRIRHRMYMGALVYRFVAFLSFCGSCSVIADIPWMEILMFAEFVSVECVSIAKHESRRICSVLAEPLVEDPESLRGELLRPQRHSSDSLRIEEVRSEGADGGDAPTPPPIVEEPDFDADPTSQEQEPPSAQQKKGSRKKPRSKIPLPRMQTSPDMHVPEPPRTEDN